MSLNEAGSHPSPPQRHHLSYSLLQFGNRINMSRDLIQEVISLKRNESWWIESEKQVIGRYGQMFHPANLDQLTKEDFKSFLLIKNNLHWGGINRSSNAVTTDMPALTKFLKVCAG